MKLVSTTSLLDTAGPLSMEFLEDLLSGYTTCNFQVRLWDGSVWGSQQQPRFVLSLKHPGALRTMFLAPSELTLGEAYIYDDLDIEGDIEAAVDLGDYLIGKECSLRERLHLAALLRRLPASSRPRIGRQPANLHGTLHSADRDRQAISYHYDLPTDFYGLWLDRGMTYSCAYFCEPDEYLDSAQQRKLDYICTKLRLRRGDRLLDIGCGWGGLVIHAAGHCGANAVGITLSPRRRQ